MHSTNKDTELNMCMHKYAHTCVHTQYNDKLQRKQNTVKESKGKPNVVEERKSDSSIV